MGKKASQLFISLSELDRIRIAIEEKYVSTTDKSSVEELIQELGKTTFRNEISEAVCGARSYLEHNIYSKLRNEDLEKNGKKRITITKPFQKRINDYLGNDLLKNFLKSRKPVNNSKKDLLNGLAYKIFYYDEVNEQEGIATGLLSFERGERVKIKAKNHQDDQETNYKGSVQLVFDKTMLILNLRIINTKERDLHVALHISNNGEIPEVLVGQYHNITNTKSIISGSIIAVLAKDQEEYKTFTPVFYQKGTEIYNNDALIPPEIRDFLYKKDQNRIKIPEGLYSLGSLGNWIDRKKTQQQLKSKVDEYPNVEEEGLKVFISAPATSVQDPKNFEKIKQGVEEIEQKLKEKFKWDCYSAVTAYEKLEDFRASNIVFNRVINQLKVCDIFIMILPNYEVTRSTSSFIEFGFILHKRLAENQGKSPLVVVFINKTLEEKERVPNHLNGAKNSPKYGIIPHSFFEFSDIIDQIDKFGVDVFHQK